MKKFLLLVLSISVTTICFSGRPPLIVDTYQGGRAVPYDQPLSSSLQPTQAFTPNAANLGAYGKVPVNYYTGSADVQIPIAELKAKDHTENVYISYKTGGHKVNEMPGPFGLGWALHAGGCINRIVKGEKDEMSSEERSYIVRFENPDYQAALVGGGYDSPGYLHHMGLVQVADYNINAFNYPRLYDLAPDEFQICADGLSGSFYFGKNGVPVFVSKTPETYDIKIETNKMDDSVVLYRSGNEVVLPVNYFTYISKIVVTDSKGVKYTFGGDASSIEFSYRPADSDGISCLMLDTLSVTSNRKQYDEVIRESWECRENKGLSRFLATANTWHLVSKEFPTTGEKIIYSYEKKGFPVNISDIHTRLAVFTDDLSKHKVWRLRLNSVFLSFTDDIGWSPSFHPYPRTNVSYTLLNPSYLTEIKSLKTSESVRFNYKDLQGLVYYPERYDFRCAMSLPDDNIADYLLDENKYYTVTSVTSRKGSTILQYTRNDEEGLIGGTTDYTTFAFGDEPLSFLNGLQSVVPHESGAFQDSLAVTPNTSILPPPEEERQRRIHLEKVIICGFSKARREYTLTYNKTRLPEFATKVSDHWGYFCMRDYGELLSLRSNKNIYMSDEFCKYTANDWFNQRRAPALCGLAESLEKITYPTGGSTTFIYEAHQYNKVSELYPKRVRNISGMAGGFRIKEIIDSLGSKAEVRSFTYNSSGILSGMPIYATIGYFLSENSNPLLEYDTLEEWNQDHMNEQEQDQMYRSRFRLVSENYINQIPSTSGSHIAYGLVTEHFGDGSSITYKYSDLEDFPDIVAETYHCYRARNLTNPYTSCDLARGLLEEVTYKNCNGVTVKKDEMTYRDSVCTSESYGDLESGLYSYERSFVYPSESPFYYDRNIVYGSHLYFYSPSVYDVYGLLYQSQPYFIRLSRCYIWGKTPYMVRKKVTLWDENGLNPISNITEYQYNSRNQLISEKTTGASVTEKRITWSGDIGNGVFAQMSAEGMVGYPVEETEILNGQVIRSTLHMYGRSSSGSIQHLAEYKSKSNTGIPRALFHSYDGFTMDASYGAVPEETYLYDRNDNLVRRCQRDSTSTSIIWGYDGVYPVMVSSARDTSNIAFYSFEENHSVLSFPTPFDEGFQSGNSHVGPFSITLPASSGFGVIVIDYMVHDASGYWSYKRQECDATLSTYTIDEGSRPIDNVRVYPKGETVISYTWYPGIGVRSSVDSMGNVAFYEYDLSGRLKAVFDIDGNPVTGYYYRYTTSEDL